MHYTILLHSLYCPILHILYILYLPSAPSANLTKVMYPSLEHTINIIPSGVHAASLMLAQCIPPMRAMGWGCCVSYTSTDEIVTTANTYLQYSNSTEDIRAQYIKQIHQHGIAAHRIASHRMPWHGMDNNSIIIMQTFHKYNVVTYYKNISL